MSDYSQKYTLVCHNGSPKYENNIRKFEIMIKSIKN